MTVAADLSQVRAQYVAGLQQASREVNALVVQLNNLNNLYTGAGLSGTFVDAELAGNTNTKHMLAVDIGTYTSNLNAVSAAITAAIQQNLAKCAGINPVT